MKVGSTRIHLRRCRRSSLRNGQRGQVLAEILVALAIFGVVAVSFMAAMITAYHGVATADEKTMAESLTRTQFEKVRNAQYIDVVSDNVDAGFNYMVMLEVETIDPDTYDNITQDVGMKLITVSIFHEGREILVSETNKAAQ